jgi:hypothetical protein
LVNSRAQEKIDSAKAFEVNDSSKFATVFVYRIKDLAGGFTKNNLYKGDSLICQVKQNSKFIIRLYQEGEIEISEKRTGQKIVLNVEFGKEYYIKCGIIPHMPKALPYFEEVSPEVGKAGFVSVAGRKK